MTSFDIRVVLNEDGIVGLETERGGEFDLMDLTAAERQQKDEVRYAMPKEREGKVVLIDSPDKAQGEEEVAIASMDVDLSPPTEETEMKESTGVVEAAVAGKKVKRSPRKKKKKSRKKQETSGTPMEVDAQAPSKKGTKASAKAAKSKGKQTPKKKQQKKKSKSTKNKGKVGNVRTRKAKAPSEGKSLAKGKKRKAKGGAKTPQGVAKARKRQRIL